MNQHIQKRVPFVVKATEEDDEYFYFSGYGSTFDNEDRVGDVMVRGCFKESLAGNGMPSLFWQHKQDEPVGVYTEAYEDNVGLFVKGKLPKADTFVSGRIMPQMKIGSVKTLSIGFTIDRDGYEWKEGVRILKKVTLWEVSLVSIPANPKAVVTSMKALVQAEKLPLQSEDTPWDEKAAEERVLAHPDMEKGFLCRSADGQMRKYLVADVADGKLMLNPRGLFAAAEALQKDDTLEDEDVASLKKLCDEYYAQLDLKSPWQKKFIGAAELKEIKSKRDLEKLLRSTGMFSKSAAVGIASLTSLDSDEDQMKAIIKSLQETRDIVKKS